jgi:hypothetical protein
VLSAWHGDQRMISGRNDRAQRLTLVTIAQRFVSVEETVEILKWACVEAEGVDGKERERRTPLPQQLLREAI